MSNVTRVDASELTFGVELETCMPVTAGVAIGTYRQGRQVPQLPPGWVAKSDVSISTPAGYVGCEIVSPVLKGADGLRQLVTVCRWLQSVGAKVNASTGFHVHVGFDADRADGMARLVHLVARHEKALFASSGTRSREQGPWCRSVKDNETYQQVFKGKKTAALGGAFQKHEERYFVLNMHRLATGGPTVEFRVFSGTTSEVKAVGYVRLCLGIVERAVNNSRLPGWDDALPPGLDRKYIGGEGRKALAWLFYAIGWRNGNPDACGVIEAGDLPTTAAITTELYRLAEKYDNQPTSGGRGHRVPRRDPETGAVTYA